MGSRDRIYTCDAISMDPAMSAIIDVQNVSFTYPRRDKPAVRDISFSIYQGTIFGFLGPSGAGKSTTQKVLIKLLSGYHGSIRILGRELTEWETDYYNHIGVSFELPNHYQKLTALENLAFFRSLYAGATQDPRHLLNLVGLGQDADRKVSQFSKGMQMRLTFARALINEPEIIFLDEPTSGLDPGNARQIRDLILDLKAQGRTLFLTTHDMTVADALCDQVAFIVDGQIAAIDSPRSLKLQYGSRQVRVDYGEAGSTQHQTFELDTLGYNQAFLNLLQSHRIETIHSEESTLEDVFITITGRSLR